MSELALAGATGTRHTPRSTQVFFVVVVVVIFFKHTILLVSIILQINR